VPEIPPRNCTLSVTGYGSVTVNAVRITHGVKILANSSGARTHRSVQPWKQTSGSCELTIKHTSRQDYVQFNEWMKVYCDSIASPDGTFGPMRIVCPAAKFDRLCIPADGIRFGGTVGEFVWTQALEFKGASDPLDIRDVSAAVSYGWGTTRYVGDGSDDGSSNFDFAVKGGGDLNTASGGLEDALYNALYPAAWVDK
jgi:hypothetical protein